MKRPAWTMAVASKLTELHSDSPCLPLAVFIVTKTFSARHCLHPSLSGSESLLEPHQVEKIRLPSLAFHDLTSAYLPHPVWDWRYKSRARSLAFLFPAPCLESLSARTSVSFKRRLQSQLVPVIFPPPLGSEFSASELRVCPRLLALTTRCCAVLCAHGPASSTEAGPVTWSLWSPPVPTAGVCRE